MSRLHKVLARPRDGRVTVENVEGKELCVSLLAFEGAEPEPGEWIVVHSGYALGAVDPVQASAIARDLRAQTAER
jgi:hydrogenase maturation factor